MTRLVRRTKEPLVRFPRTRVIAMTWGIPEDFGGLTSVLLRRSAMIADLGGRDVPILTFDASLDVEHTTRQLIARGELRPGVQLRNCWSEIAGMGDRELKAFAGSAGPLPAHGPTDTGADVRSEDAQRRIWVGTDGKKRLVEHLRPDGTVSVRDERKCREGRGLVILDHEGAPIGRWNRVRDLYFAWIDHVVGDASAVILSDSKYVGSFLHHYRRPKVRTVQVFHNPHLTPKAVSTEGPFTESRASIIFEHEKFDGLAFLTKRQADDFTAAFPRRGRTFVVPNSREIPATLPDVEEPREPSRGIMLARLSGQKRIDHTVRALAELQRETPHVRAHVDVFGSGPSEKKIMTMIEAEGAGDRIALRGYDPTASTQLASASFLVLSSKYEGLPLVLVEAMAAGCIPVAYDVRYGPGDVIAHGVDGLVVPAGDVRALAAAIRRIATMDEADRREMRRAAQRTARRFDDLTVTRQWADVCGALTGPRAPLLASGSGAMATRAEFLDDQAGDLLLSGNVLGAWPLGTEEVRLRIASSDGT
ncbi:glycosyltransferase [Brevibacterium jeotgali]|uniref:glycosyltransferase n=1 Tax=Brevibacterium jeotgali TaxID=1262550 RepID=UPI0015E0C33D|nr:glycosyltransferase [Brevibacterium jeotgali]